MAPKKVSKSLTLSSINTVDLNSQMTNYENAMKKRTDLRKQVKKLAAEIIRYVEPYAEKEAKKSLDNITVKGLAQFIVVRKEDESVAKLKPFEKLAFAFNQISDKRPELELLEKEVGKKAVDFICSIGAAYGKFGDHEDVEATAKARKTYTDMLAKYDDAQAELDAVEEEVANTKEYLDTFEQLANISQIAKPTRQRR